MTFPEIDRVIYERNPLVQVICQLKFAPILTIEASPPADFQEALGRDAYPAYQERLVAKVEDVPQELRGIVEGGLSALLGDKQRTAHEFVSDDRVWRATLTREFVALTTTEYRRWEVFRERMTSVVQALVGAYDAPVFTRVGLRYQDLITRSTLNLGDAPWASLLAPSLAGELADPSFDEALITGARRVIRVKAADRSPGITLQHGLVRLKDGNAGDELSYLIDADFFVEERIDVEQAFATLDQANSIAGRLWRWSITDRLHDALGPQPVG